MEEIGIMKGIYSALMVPYNEDGSINEKGLREIVRYNIDKMKVDGLYVGGSTEENFMISTEEKKRVFEIAIDEAKDAVHLPRHLLARRERGSKSVGKFCRRCCSNRCGRSFARPQAARASGHTPIAHR